MNQPVIVLRESGPLRWGGHLRRRYVLSKLAESPGARDVAGFSAAILDRVLPRPRRWTRRPWVAAATPLSHEAVEHVSNRARGWVVDVHDDAVAQTRALGLDIDPDWVARTMSQKRANLDAFRWHVAPSRGIADIADLDLARTIIAPNGSDTSLISSGPWPTRPAIGMVSGAAPARGIETLVEAGRMLRPEFPDLRVTLWLAATSPMSQTYLGELQDRVVDEGWVTIRSTSYEEFGTELASVAVHCIPTPPSEYWDAVSPIKLFDAMASGRPLVVTPRTEMAAEVTRHDAGLVADGETAADLAEAIRRLLNDADEARRLGSNARTAAVEEHDWADISAELALELFNRGC